MIMTLANEQPFSFLNRKDNNLYFKQNLYHGTVQSIY
jgi:hypothetical protein